MMIYSNNPPSTAANSWDLLSPIEMLQIFLETQCGPTVNENTLKKKLKQSLYNTELLTVDKATLVLTLQLWPGSNVNLTDCLKKTKAVFLLHFSAPPPLPALLMSLQSSCASPFVTADPHIPCPKLLGGSFVQVAEPGDCRKACSGSQRIQRSSGWASVVLVFQKKKVGPSPQTLR